MRQRRVGRAAGLGQPWPFELVFDEALWTLCLFLLRCAAGRSAVIAGRVVVFRRGRHQKIVAGGRQRHPGTESIAASGPGRQGDMGTWVHGYMGTSSRLR